MENENPLDQQKLIANYSLKQLIMEGKKLIRMLEENDGEITSEVEDIMRMVSDLKNNKIDKIYSLVKSLKELIVYAGDKIKNTEWTISKIEQYILESIQMRLERTIDMSNVVTEADYWKQLTIEEKKLDGDIYRIRVQASPPSVSVHDADALPNEFKRKIIKITYALEYDDENMFNYFMQLFDYFKDDPNFKGSVDHDCKISAIKKYLKESPEDTVIPGVTINQGVHLRYEINKSTTTTKKKLDLVPAMIGQDDPNMRGDL